MDDKVVSGGDPVYNHTRFQKERNKYTALPMVPDSRSSKLKNRRKKIEIGRRI
jgi:hypothetical protein